MAVTFLTTEDANQIIEKLADIQKVIDKLDVKVGSMDRYESKVDRLAEEKAQWKQRIKFYQSNRYKNKIIKEYQKSNK